MSHMVVCLTCSFLQDLVWYDNPSLSPAVPTSPHHHTEAGALGQGLKVYEVLCMLGSLQGCLCFHCVTRTVNCWSLNRSLSPSTLPWLLYTQP